MLCVARSATTCCQTKRPTGRPNTAKKTSKGLSQLRLLNDLHPSCAPTTAIWLKCKNSVNGMMKCARRDIRRFGNLCDQVDQGWSATDASAESHAVFLQRATALAADLTHTTGVRMQITQNIHSLVNLCSSTTPEFGPNGAARAGSMIPAHILVIILRRLTIFHNTGDQ